jgi:hypothetical protein
MGKPDNLTTADFVKAAKAMNQTDQQAKENTYKALKKELGKEEQTPKA